MTVWEQRIRRAEQLAVERGPSAALLSFYTQLLRSQRDIYDSLDDRPLTGTLDRDLTLLHGSAAVLIRDVAHHGPDPLAAEARELAGLGSAFDERLISFWRAPSDTDFFAKAILQPYGQRLAEATITPADRMITRAGNRCPACGGSPQLSILDSAPIAGDGSSRRLLCANCLNEWPLRRVMCPHCGEGDEHKLGYFQSNEFEHVRVDACDTCRHYLKSVDLQKLGLAVPLVDEVAAAPLDAWAHERGYQKIELNLVGM